LGFSNGFNAESRCEVPLEINILFMEEENEEKKHFTNLFCPRVNTL